MSWLAANWYSVLALFGTPAMFGIASWFIARRIAGQRERDDRARDARKLGDFQFPRLARRG